MMPLTPQREQHPLMDLATVLKNLQPRSQTDVTLPEALGSGLDGASPLRSISPQASNQPAPEIGGTLGVTNRQQPTPINLAADRTFHSPNQPYAGVTAPQPTLGIAPVDTSAGPLVQSPSAPLKPANVRPAFQNTGDAVGDAERYANQAEAYKPENHNSWVKGALLGLVRGVAQGAQESGNNLLGELGGGIAGLGVGAVDKSADERFANENYTKPQAYAGLNRVLGTEKEKAGIAETNARALDIPLKRDAQNTKMEGDAIEKDLRRRQHYTKGEDPELDDRLAAANYQVSDFDSRKGEVPHFINPNGENYVWDSKARDWVRTNAPLDRVKVPDPEGVLPGDRAKMNAADRRQARQIAANLMYIKIRDENRTKQKGIPQAKAASTASPEDAVKPHQGRYIDMQKVQDQAAIITQARSGETDEDYEKRYDDEVERLLRKAVAAGATLPAASTSQGTISAGVQ